MSENKAAYRQIFKATSIFGGVQVFTILIAIIKSKAVAVLLGTAGMGIMGLFTSTTSFITSLTNFGLNTSAVKNIASAYASGDEEKVGKTVAVFRLLVWGTGLLGFLITLVLSPWISKLTFGDNSYTTAFMFLSITLLLTDLSTGQAVLLRGIRKIHYMAKATLLGSLSGLIVSLPLYYFFRKNGIVPAIIATSLCALFFTWLFSRKVPIPKIRLDKKLAKHEGKDMLKMGFLISMSGLITLGASFLVRTFISRLGSIGDVGLYVAGFALINTYVGMVFTAMSSDYYPRLAAVADDDRKYNIEINQQAEIALLILSPIIIVFLLFINWGVILLYSKDFLPVVSMIRWGILGIFFKAVSWPIAFIFLAKADSKVFFWNELIANIYMLLLNLGGYYYFGLTGLGVSFLLSYFLYFIQVFLVTRRLYGFQLGNGAMKIFFPQFLIAIGCLALISFLDKDTVYIMGSLLVLSSCTISWRGLDNRLSLRQFLKRYF